MEKSKRLIEQAKGKVCDICNLSIDAKQAEDKDFEYSKTKRKGDIWVHRHCWIKLYGGMQE